MNSRSNVDLQEHLEIIEEQLSELEAKVTPEESFDGYHILVYKNKEDEQVYLDAMELTQYEGHLLPHYSKNRDYAIAFTKLRAQFMQKLLAIDTPPEDMYAKNLIIEHL